jgi:transposase, IS30 family
MSSPYRRIRITPGDLKAHTQADLDRVADELNNRPRQTLGWLSPSETLDDALR